MEVGCVCICPCIWNTLSPWRLVVFVFVLVFVFLICTVDSKWSCAVPVAISCFFYSDWLPFNLLYLYFAFGHCTCICICIFVRQSRVQVSLCLWPFPPAMLLLVQALSTKVKCPHTLGIPVFVFVFYLCLSMYLCFLFIFVFAFCICNKQSFTSPRPPGVHQGRVSAHIGQQCCPLFVRFVQPTFLPVLSIEAFL